jgi:hypothetical protein
MTALLGVLAIAGYQNRDNARRLGKRGAAGEGGGLLGQLRKNLARPVPVVF